MKRLMFLTICSLSTTMFCPPKQTKKMTKIILTEKLKLAGITQAALEKNGEYSGFSEEEILTIIKHNKQSLPKQPNVSNSEDRSEHLKLKFEIAKLRAGIGSGRTEPVILPNTPSVTPATNISDARLLQRITEIQSLSPFKNL